MPAAQRVDEERQQDQHADGHVRAVEAGEHEERRPEHVGVEGEAFAIELGELESLAADEGAGRGTPSPSSHMRMPRTLPRWIAESASTIVTLLISRMNELTDVYGMSKRSPG